MRFQVSIAFPQKTETKQRVPGVPSPDGLTASASSQMTAAGADCELPVRIVESVEAGSTGEGLEER